MIRRSRVSHCHKLVAEIAKEAVGQLFEIVMHDDLVFSEWKRANPGCQLKELERRFIARNWAKCIPFARATMARLLTTPIDPGLKDQIMEALSLDTTLMRGRQEPHIVLGAK